MQRILAENRVILVDDRDEQIGVEDKRIAHTEGKLHRAFSILVFNSKGELLVQQRAYDKHHSGGLWSNTCCGHPKPAETLRQATERRLHEEMGFYCPLSELFSFVYRADVGNGSVEHEYDHVFFGDFDGKPNLNSSEVIDSQWIRLDDLRWSIQAKPDRFTAWLVLIMNRLMEDQRIRETITLRS